MNNYIEQMSVAYGRETACLAPYSVPGFLIEPLLYVLKTQWPVSQVREALLGLEPQLPPLPVPLEVLQQVGRWHHT